MKRIKIQYIFSPQTSFKHPTESITESTRNFSRPEYKIENQNYYLQGRTKIVSSHFNEKLSHPERDRRRYHPHHDRRFQLDATPPNICFPLATSWWRGNEQEPVKIVTKPNNQQQTSILTNLKLSVEEPYLKNLRRLK